MAYDKLGSSNS